MALASRIIPCLDIKNEKVVKGINFKGLQETGCPIEMAKKYNDDGADEIVFLDISASSEGKKTRINLIKKVAKEIFIPLTIGGGISSLNDIYELLNAGCDKISINSSAISNPNLIEQSAKRFGSQCVVVAIDTKYQNNEWEIYTHGGTKKTDKELISWAKEAQERGAGELLITSMDHDGQQSGYDLEQISKLHDIVTIPIIASGGAGKINHFYDVFKVGASGALAASVFHFGLIDIKILKQHLKDNGIEIRI